MFICILRNIYKVIGIRKTIQGRLTIGKIHPEIIPALIILTSFLFLFPGKLFSQSNLPDTINTLWIKYKKVKDDSSKVVLLTNLAFFYHEYLEDEKKADSLADAAITVAEMSLHSSSLIRAYNSYLESTDNAEIGRAHV